MQEWETVRPVTRFSHYSELISPISDWTGTYKSLYEPPATPEKAHLYSTYTSSLFNPAAGCAVYFNKAARSTWDIEHNLGTYDLNVQCFDVNLKLIEVVNVTHIKYGWIRITFEEPQSGYAFIAASDYTHTQSISASLWTIAHTVSGSGFIDKYVLSQIDDENRIKGLIPMTTTAVSANVLTSRFYSSVPGYGIISQGTYIHTELSPAAVWNISHNLNYNAVMVQCYDGSDELIYPKSIQIIDGNNVVITWETATEGHATIKAISRSNVSPDDITGSLSYFKVGTGGSSSWNYTVNNDIETQIGSTYSITTSGSDNNYYYINTTINDGITMPITEIGLFDNDDNLKFYTYCSQIYKPSTVMFKIHYRISKGLS
jgi:hypothetical protein